MPGGAIDDQYTWDLDRSEGGARRASLADLGDAQVQDDLPSPNVGSDIYAGLINELVRQVAGANRVVSAAWVWVRVANGVPTVYRAIGMGSNVGLQTFKATRVSVGVCQITWALGALPPMLGEPTAALNSGPGLVWGQWMASNANGVEVHTTDQTGAPTDLNFVVSIL